MAIKIYDKADIVKKKESQTYCSNEPILMQNNMLEYAGIKFWDLDNL